MLVVGASPLLNGWSPLPSVAVAPVVVRLCFFWACEGAVEDRFRREVLNVVAALHLAHELLPGPGGLAAAAVGFGVVVVAEPDRGGELWD